VRSYRKGGGVEGDPEGSSGEIRKKILFLEGSSRGKMPALIVSRTDTSRGGSSFPEKSFQKVLPPEGEIEK